MSMLDGILGQVAGNVDVKNLAEKVGLSPEMAESAIAALGRAHTAPGDTVETAAGQTGLSPDVLQQIVAHLGGEGALGHLASLLGDGSQGDALGGLAGLAGGLFNKS
jgi:hypothetical protein